MRTVNSDLAPKPHGHYVQGRLSNGALTTSMQLPVDRSASDPDHLTQSNLTNQAVQLLTNLKNILEAAGCDASNVVKVTFYLTSIDDWHELNQLAENFFGSHRPARGVVAVAAISKGYKIAADLIAEVPREHSEDEWSTADLVDSSPDRYDVLDFDWRQYGQVERFSGPIETVDLADSNSALRELLSTAGNGRVAVVKADGSSGRAVVGDQLAQLAIDNHWRGIVVFGRVRDVRKTRTMPIGIAALGTCPSKGQGDTAGQTSLAIELGDVIVRPEMEAFVDTDGILVRTT